MKNTMSTKKSAAQSFKPTEMVLSVLAESVVLN